MVHEEVVDTHKLWTSTKIMLNYTVVESYQAIVMNKLHALQKPIDETGLSFAGREHLVYLICDSTDRPSVARVLVSVSRLV